MKHILLIDDHPIVRLGIKSLLESNPSYQVCGEAGSRKEALELLSTGCPDLAIVDLILGHDDGLEFVKEVSLSCPDLKILVMTMQDESVYAERVIRAGADGFITKKDATEHLLDAVETILKGDIYLSRTSSLRVLGRVLREESPQAQTSVSTLSDRELHVFQMIGTGLKTKEIAKSLSLSPKTIETYRENIKRKLELKNADALKTSAVKWVETGKA
jgi:DNA-binding NarL/FixJ family response regulator